MAKRKPPLEEGTATRIQRRSSANAPRAARKRRLSDETMTELAPSADPPPPGVEQPVPEPPVAFAVAPPVTGPRPSERPTSLLRALLSRARREWDERTAPLRARVLERIPWLGRLASLYRQR